MADTTKTPQSQQQPDQDKKDEGKLPSPQDKYENYEADRKRLAEEHSANA